MASPNSGEDTRDNLVDIVKQLYPDALTRTYIVPPVQFTRVPYNTDTVPGTGQEVLVLPSSEQLQQQQANIQADLAQQHVLHNLQQLGDSGKEVMFVVSELNFKDYLNKPFYAKHTGKLPKPANLPKELRHHGKQGDFDILVIHRQYGILVGEIKSVGKTEASRADTEVVKVIGKAVKQLDKCEVHARHMVSDIAPDLTVRKTLFLPYVSQAQLQRILDDDNNSKLQQAVCQSLGAANTTQAVQLCCCSDQLSQPASYWHVTPAVLSQLSTWWQHRMACTVDTRLTDQLYLDIVARFVGQATTVSVPCFNNVRVEVRTAGQAVAELGRRLALLVLTLQQLGLMNRDPPQVCITGAPGTGDKLTPSLDSFSLNFNFVCFFICCWSCRRCLTVLTWILNFISKVEEELSPWKHLAQPFVSHPGPVRDNVILRRDHSQSLQTKLRERFVQSRASFNGVLSRSEACRHLIKVRS
ncbi:uncharacterized protein [Littorina saxatilis]|uniref:uncharacterized protein n=1 Tax=Littorina saxatilis TaxID=31220 RepID=UPI0038B5E6F0